MKKKELKKEIEQLNERLNTFLPTKEELNEMESEMTKNTEQVLNSLYCNSLKGEETITNINPDYNGIAKVMSQIIELYKVCDNKELVDKCLYTFTSPSVVIK